MVEWNEEERMLLEMVRKFTKQKLAPRSLSDWELKSSRISDRFFVKLL